MVLVCENNICVTTNRMISNLNVIHQTPLHLCLSNKIQLFHPRSSLFRLPLKITEYTMLNVRTDNQFILFHIVKELKFLSYRTNEVLRYTFT